MKFEQLNCPSCGAAISGDFSANQQFECSSCGSLLMLSDLATEETIFCPHCRTINSSAKRYCSNCGEKLRVKCIMCHAENRIDAVHCANCGVNIQRSIAKHRAMLAQRQQMVKERQQAFKAKEERQKEEKLQRLLDALDEPENHDFALYQLNQLGLDAVNPLIETLLHDDDPDARYGSARALGQICSEKEIKGLIKSKGLTKGRAIKALIKSLADDEPAVRFWSAEALGKFHGTQGKRGVEPLTALLKDPHEGVRLQAQRSLQQINS